MSRRPLLSRTVRGLGALVLLAGAAGCADTVALDPPEPTASTAVEVCASLLDDVPGTVAGQESVRVAPAGAGRAWGSPAIVLRCGVDRPAALTPTARCDVVDDVGWFTQEDDDHFVFTTIGRAAYAEVAVPKSYDPAADALSDLAPAIVAHDPVVDPCV